MKKNLAKLVDPNNVLALITDENEKEALAEPPLTLGRVGEVEVVGAVIGPLPTLGAQGETMDGISIMPVTSYLYPRTHRWVEGEEELKRSSSRPTKVSFFCISFLFLVHYFLNFRCLPRGECGM